MLYIYKGMHEVILENQAKGVYASGFAGSAYFTHDQLQIRFECLSNSL